MSWLSEECAAELRTLGEADFVRAWTTLFGEPPATLIDRSEMVELIRAYLMPRGHGRPPATATATMPGSEPRKAA